MNYTQYIIYPRNVNNTKSFKWSISLSIFRGSKNLRKKLNNKKTIQAESAPAATGDCGLAAAFLDCCCCCCGVLPVCCNPCSSATPWKSFPGKPWSKSYETGVGGKAPVWAWGDCSTAITRRNSSNAFPIQHYFFLIFRIQFS